jgi:hypothetical protein
MLCYGLKKGHVVMCYSSRDRASILHFLCDLMKYVDVSCADRVIGLSQDHKREREVDSIPGPAILTCLSILL